MDAQQHSYRQFFSANDFGSNEPFEPALANDEDDDEPIDDVPPPAWFRKRNGKDAFPACEALLHWPTNYPVEGDADLDEAEWGETDARLFRYSEPELEAWSGMVAAVLLPLSEPVFAPVGSRPLPGSEKRRVEPRASEVNNMAYQNPSNVYQQQSPRTRGPPPIAKWSAGDLSVCAWSNPAPSGGRFITLTVGRRYRVEQEWKSTRSLRLTDVPMLTALLQQAFNQMALRHQMVEVAPVERLPDEGGPDPSPGARLTDHAFGPGLEFGR